MKRQSLKKNFAFQATYKIIVLLIPLILSPYLTRILGSNELGIYTYSNTIAFYFVLFAGLGISRHGQRIISARRNDELLLRKTFWSLYFDQIIVSIVVSIVYCVYALVFAPNDNNVYTIQIIYVVSSLFDITWLFCGLENFSSVVMKNMLIKVCECAFIFIFVRTSNDLWIYTLVMSISVLLGQAVLLPKAIKEFKPIKFSLSDMAEHIKPLCVLFIPVIASNLYTSFDKTLLGLMSSNDNVAFYEYSSKLINIPKQILGVIGIVMFPRACRSFVEGKVEEQRRNIDVSIFATCFLGFAFMFGFMALGNKLAILYYGEAFSECGNAIVCLSPLIIITMLGDVIRNEYLVPANKDWLFTISIVVSAILNIILSVILIPVIGLYGAIVGTIVAELLGTILQIIFSRKIYPIKQLLKNVLPFSLIGLIMFLIVYFVDVKTEISIKWLLIEFLIGFIVYLIFSFVIIKIFFKNYYADILSIFLKNKKRNKK